MPTTEGRILSIESKTGTTAAGKEWEKIGVHLQDKATGNEEVFYGFLPEQKKFVGKEGTQWEILWQPDPKYPSQKQIKGGSQKAIPPGDQLKGEDTPKLSQRDDLIVKQNMNTAAHNIVSAMMNAKLIVTADELFIDGWLDHFYTAGLKRMGIE